MTDLLSIIYVEKNPNVIEQFRNALRVAGISADLRAISSYEDLTTAITKHNFDIAVTTSQTNLITLEALVEQLKPREISILCVGSTRDSEPPSAFIKRGADFYALEEDPEFVILTLKKTLDFAALRRNLQKAKQEIVVLDQKNNELLDEANIPITYLIGGCFTYSNEAFKKYLGQDAIDGAPGFSDFIVKAHQALFAKQLKSTEKTGKQLQFNTSIHHPLTKQIESVKLIMRPGIYENEKCIELEVHANREDTSVLKNQLNATARQLGLLVEQNKVLEQNISKFDQEKRHLQDQHNILIQKLKMKETQPRNENTTNEYHEAAQHSYQLLNEKYQNALKQVQLVNEKYNTLFTEHRRHTDEKQTHSALTYTHASAQRKNVIHKIEQTTRQEGSWLLMLHLEDIPSFWQRDGIKAVDEYRIGLCDLFQELYPDAVVIEYADTALLFYLVQEEAATINRLSDTLRNQAESFFIEFAGKRLTSQAKTAVVAINMDVNDFKPLFYQLENQIGLVKIYSLAAEEDALPETVAIPSLNSAMISGVIPEFGAINDLEGQETTDKVDSFIFNEIAKSLQQGKVEAFFTPIAGFASISNDHYYFEPHIFKEDGTRLDLKRGQLASASHPVSLELDIWSVKQIVESLIKHQSVSKPQLVLIDMSLESVNNPKFLEWISALFTKAPQLGKFLAFAVAEQIAEQNLQAVTHFMSAVQRFGSKRVLSGFSCEQRDLIAQIDMDYVTLSDRVITRMSRSRDSAVKTQFRSVLDDIGHKKVQIIAEGVDAPAQMALVWEYNIGLALGKMIGEAGIDLTFNFDSLMV